MPRLSVWMLRLSLLALFTGGLAGALVLGGFPPALVLAGRFRAMHLELMLFGWLVQFVLGVAYWILPRHAAGSERGSVALGWTAFGLFQAGIGLALIGEGGPAAEILVPAGRVLLVGAILLFVGLFVPRIKPFGTT